MTYRMFINSFHPRTASRIRSSLDRLYYVEQQMIGEFKEIKSGCLCMDPDLSYINACNLLNKEYGDPYNLSIIFLKQIND